jgi:glyoxylase-like metal-dependent hydrolase (beta-lactamase superfamily II)
MKLYAIETGNAKFDGGAVFGVVPKVIWEKIYPADENNLCNTSIRSLLVVDEDRKILFDTGIGDKQDEKFLSNFHLNGDDNLLKSLLNVGIKPEDITDIVFTHLHFDHCGGATKYNRDRTGIELTFSNANIHVSRKQWDWAMHPNSREKASYLKENLIPLLESGRLSFIEQQGELFPNIDIKLYYGHTEAQVIPFIRFNGKTLVFTADFIASVAHIPLAYIPSYDIRPLISMEEKAIFYKDALENNYILFFAHDLPNECCTLQNTEKGVRVKDTFKLAEIV